MRKIFFAAIVTLASLAGCKQKTEFVTPDWARPIFPDDGGTISIDYFKPDDIRAFTWQVRPNSTYKVYFGTDMHFENSVVFDMGTSDSLKLSNSELIETLREVWPDFTSIKRFFWKVEQNTAGTVRSSWRYFNAIIAVESFTDPRDGQQYSARQFVLDNGKLLTVMGENLRAENYTDGMPPENPAKWGGFEDEVYNHRAGRYYTWRAATRLTWDEAKQAFLDGEAVQGICPDGWHLPSHTEIHALLRTIGMEQAGNIMKDPNYWSLAEGVTNSTQMSIVPTGAYWNEYADGIYDADNRASLWTSTPALKGLFDSWQSGNKLAADDAAMAMAWGCYNDAQGGYIYQSAASPPAFWNEMYPVRCVMDEM